VSVPGIRFLALAETEIDDAADWYAVQDDGDQLSDDFLRELDRVVRLVHERPQAWTEIEPGVRRMVLRRFSYALIYVIKPQEILVLAVAHHSREPGYWQGRE
jgi:plasmid stabilization system protein ParE